MQNARNHRLPGWLNGEDPPANAEDSGDTGLILGSGSSPWRRKRQPTPVFLPGKSHGQTSLGWGGYSPWDCRVGHDWMTEHRCTHARNHSIWAPHTDSDEGKLVNTKLELELSLHPKSKPSTSFFWAFFMF